MLSPIKICAGIFLAMRLLGSPLEYALHMDSAVVVIPDQPYLNFQSGQAMSIEILFLAETSAPQNLMNKAAPLNTEWANNMSVLTGWLVDLNSYYMREGDAYVLSTFIAAPSILHAGIAGDAFGIGQNHFVPEMENQWHHLTFQFTGQRFRTFVNSAQIQESEEIDLESYNTSGVPLLIGGYNIASLPSLNGISSFLNGMIDELRIWNRVRSPAAIQRTMFEALDASYYATGDSGLVGYYRFDAIENLGAGDDGKADDIRDLSIYGNHADIAYPTRTGESIQTRNNLVYLIHHDDLVTQSEKYSSQAEGFTISSNYPNPFNAVTHFQICLDVEAYVQLAIFDIRGRMIASPVNRFETAGSHLLSWDAGEQPSGIYLYQIRIGDHQESGKMIVEK